MSATSSSFIVHSVDGLRLVGDIQGPADAAPVVLLHGGGQSRSAWRGVAARLGRAGYRACSIDLRGHGDSDWSPILAYELKNFVADLLMTIEALGPVPAVLVGASLGGHIALLTAAWYPSKARMLLLADVTPWIDELLGDEIRNALRAANSGFESFEEASAAIARLQGRRPPKGNHDRLRKHLRRRDDGRLYFRWDVRLMDDKRLRGGGAGGLYQTAARQLDLPILAMRAELSSLTLQCHVDAFRHVQPALEDVVIPGVGHMLSGDVNDEYSIPILDFIRRHTSGVNPAKPTPW